ncbi:ketosteroid isomerase [Mucilaginibacter sp. PPCGB 2223]|uniref:nuclear transport factor 2 family protein n=1 Tax=Mucilaginibacter sp. PPCGB 2223 TaxID=1886027 RepID=UPI0008271C8E|nr:nuclear transport factor 2 family protein [Mucilaginibacter sp. PPCGB 2223]OCX50416.1 ketosteroid isomerase [Mucilaginibacter sp. PPCGB 2223]
MNINQQLIDRFYTAFQKKDYATMQQCYAANAMFTDAVFVNLDAGQVKAMWQMLCKSSSGDFKVEYRILSADDDQVTAEWTAWYTFSATGNKVVNRVRADFTLHNGEIISHTDQFNFYEWARQALGLPGLLLGWTPFFRHKVQASAAGRLKAYMEKNGL